jgi:hypothetical protein
MMLNIDSEPMTRPMTNLRRAKKLRSTNGALARELHGQQQEERGRRQRERANNGERCRQRVRQCMQGEDQRHHQRGQQNKANPIRAPTLCTASTGGRQAVRCQTSNCGQHERDVEPEDHAPACQVRKGAAEQRPDAEAKHQEAGPSGDRCCPALRRRAGADRNQRAGHRDRCRQALHGTSDQQLSLRAGGGNVAGRSAEQRQSQHRCQPCAEPIRCLATEHDEGRGNDQIGIDCPLHAGRGEEKLGPHVWQGGHDPRTVGADRKHRQTRRPQNRREPRSLLQHCCVLRKHRAGETRPLPPSTFLPFSGSQRIRSHRVCNLPPASFSFLTARRSLHRRWQQWPRPCERTPILNYAEGAPAYLSRTETTRRNFIAAAAVAASSAASIKSVFAQPAPQAP